MRFAAAGPMIGRCAVIALAFSCFWGSSLLSQRSVQNRTSTPQQPTVSESIRALNSSGLNVYSDLIKHDPTVVVPALIPSLDNDSHATRIIAINILNHFGPRSAPAVPALIAAFTTFSNDHDMRVRVVETFGAIGPAAAASVPLLTQVMTNGAGPAQGIDEAPDKATIALGQIGPNASAAVPMLVARMTASFASDGGYDPAFATTSLGQIGDLRALVPLERAWTLNKGGTCTWRKHLDPEVACATMALARLGSPGLSFLDSVYAATKQPGEKVETILGFRAAGTAGVSRLITAAQLPASNCFMSPGAFLSGQKPCAVVAIDGLEALGAHAQPALPVLHTLMRNDPDEDVRRHAEHAVEVIQAAVRLGQSQHHDGP